MDRQTLEFSLQRKLHDAHELRKRMMVLDNQYRILHQEIVDLRESLNRRDDAVMIEALERAR